MSLADIAKRFDGIVAVKAWIARKAERQIGHFLDGWGPDRLRECIQRNIWITDCLALETKVELKQRFLPYVEYMDKFSNEEVYKWIPQRHRLFIAALPGGPQYAMRQIAIIREYFMP